MRVATWIAFLLGGVIALVTAYSFDLMALSAATSGGLLIVYAAVNVTNAKLAVETGSRRWISLVAAVVCVAGHRTCRRWTWHRCP